MKRFLSLFALLLALAVPAAAEPGHQFPPLKPEELAKIQAALPHATVKPARARRLLVFYRTEGFVHSSIPYGNEAIKEMGEKTGAFTADFSDNMDVFTPHTLETYDAILFNSTTGLKFAEPGAREALPGFVKAGKGIIGMHAATDNFPTWEEGRALMGGAFDGHPWTSGDVEAVKLDDPANPLIAPFGGKGFWVNDEIYQTKAPYDRSQVRELLSLDMSKPENARPPEKIHRTDNDFPICWIKGTEGGGRVFYCSLGHNPSIFWNPQVLQVYLNGVQFALGDLAFDTTPTGKLTATPAALAPTVPDPINGKPSAKPAAPPSSPAAGQPGPVATPIPVASPSAPGGSLAEGVKAVSTYDYGASRVPIVAFDTYIRSHPDDRPKVEEALLPLLTRDDVAAGAKDYVCRWLGVIGSDASVPALQKLTCDPKLSHLAVYALLSLHTPVARAALLDGLGASSPPLRPAIIGAIGRSGMADAVPVLAKAASSADEAEATAALDALGFLGTPAALEALRAAQVTAPLETARQWALLHAAAAVSRKGASGRDATEPVFTSLLKPGMPAALRNAAATGYIHADPAAALNVVLPLLKDDDARVRSGAARLTPQLSADCLKALAPSLPGLDPATQVAIVDNLVETRSIGFEPILQVALASPQSKVHLTAIADYGIVDLPDSMAVLLPLLSKGGDEAAAATASLKQLSLPDTNTHLREAVTSAPGSVKAALLTILAARQDRAAFDLFIASTSEADPVVATAAFQGVEALAGADDLDRVAALLPQARTNAAHKTLNAALLRCARLAADKDRAVDFLIDALHDAASPDTREILLAAIASVPSSKATAYLQTQLAAPAVDARKDAVRALSTAHTQEADKLLLDAAAQGAEPSEKILALRGYLDGIQTRSLSDRQRIEAYRTAWPLAIRAEEKQAILDALRHIKSKDASKAFDELSAQAAKST